ncbi:MAG: dTDP-glucose 4,6-dehydratase [Candidatus Dormiibacterota bacterium]
MAERALLPSVGEGIPTRLLVAGGAGFIGSAFVRQLLGEGDGFSVTVLDKLTYAGNLANLKQVDTHPGFRFVAGDICDGELVGKLAREVDCIVNFAAETHVDRSILDPSGFIRTDVLGTHQLLEGARLAGHARFLQVSTDEVYGDVEPPSRSRESDSIRPRSPYSASKASGDLLCFAYQATYGLPVLVTRGSNTYGPYQYPEKIVPLFITQALDHLPLPLYGDGTAVRDYLHVDDHARGIATVLACGVGGEAYNLGRGEEPISGMTVAQTVLRLTGGADSLIQPVRDRPGHDRRYALDSGKAQGLGWRATVDFEEGMARTVRWFEEHREWWAPIKSGEFLDFYRRNYHPLAGSAPVP